MSAIQENLKLGHLVQKLQNERRAANQVLSPRLRSDVKVTWSDEKLESKDKLIEFQNQEILRLREYIEDMRQKHDQMQETCAQLSGMLEASKRDKQRLFEMFEREREECIDTNSKLSLKDEDLDEVCTTLEGALEEITDKEQEVKNLEKQVKRLKSENKMKTEFLKRDSKKIEMMQFAQNVFLCLMETQRRQIEAFMAEKDYDKLVKEKCKIRDTNLNGELKLKVCPLEADKTIWEAINSSRNVLSINTSLSSNKSCISVVKIEIEENKFEDSSTEDSQHAFAALCVSPYRCKVCPKTFADLEPIKRHMRLDHQMPGVLDDMKFGCKFCGSMFKKEKKFIRHCCNKIYVDYLFNTMKSFTQKSCNVDLTPVPRKNREEMAQVKTEISDPAGSYDST